MSRKTQMKIRRMLPYAAVLMIGALIVLGTALFVKPKEESDIGRNETKTPEEKETRKKKETAESTQEKTDETVTQDSTATADSSENETETGNSEPSETEPQKPSVSALDALAIEDLVSRYFTAKVNCDADTLNNIVDTKKKYKAAEMAYENEQFIDHYGEFRIHTEPGPADDYFITYVKYNIYFKGINTGAPSLNRYIIKKQKDGSFKFFNQKISSEIQEQIDAADKTPLVQEMVTQVNDELQAACEKDLDLNYLLNILNGTDESQETQESETETQAETKKSKKKKKSSSSSETESSSEETQASEAQNP